MICVGNLTGRYELDQIKKDLIDDFPKYLCGLAIYITYNDTRLARSLQLAKKIGKQRGGEKKREREGQRAQQENSWLDIVNPQIKLERDAQ